MMAAAAMLQVERWGKIVSICVITERVTVSPQLYIRIMTFELRYHILIFSGTLPISTYIHKCSMYSTRNTKHYIDYIDINYIDINYR